MPPTPPSSLRRAFRGPFALALAAALPAGFAQTTAGSLPPDVVALEQFEVFGLRRSLITSAEEQRAALNHKDILSTDDFGKLPDNNIAEAISRLSGIYVDDNRGEGRYVSIRGVAANLNNVTIAGQTLAVSDTDGRTGRAAPLDVFSAASISRIEVIKAVTPEMDAQSIGGTINLIPPSAFDRERRFVLARAERTFNDFSRGHGYRTEINFSDRFGADRTWGVFVGVHRSADDYLTQYVDGKNMIRLTNYQTVDGATAPFGDIIMPQRVTLSTAFGRRENMGFSSNLDWRPNPESRFWLRAYASRSIREEYRPETEIILQDLGDPRRFRLTAPDTGYTTRGSVEQSARDVRIERPVHQVVLGGERQLGSSWTLDANLNVTGAKEWKPYLNYYQNSTAADARNAPGGADNSANAVMRWDTRGYFPVFEPVPGTNAAGVSKWPFPGTRPEEVGFYRLRRIRYEASSVNERTWSGDVNLAWHGEVAGVPTRLKTGLKHLDRDRAVDDLSNRWNFIGTNPFSTVNDRGEPLGILLTELPGARRFRIGDSRYAAQQGPVANKIAQDHFFASHPERFTYDVQGSLTNSVEDDYELTERIDAAYAMFELTPVSSLTVLGGVRAERTRVQLDAYTAVVANGRFDGIQPIGQSVSYTDWMPNLQFRWVPTSDWVVRGALTRTLGRPNYPDQAPIGDFSYADPLGTGVFTGSLSEGNPGLKPYRSWGYDVSASWYLPERRGVLSAGLFHKSIDNAIYPFRFEAVSDGIQFAGKEFERLANGNILFRGREFERLDISTFNNAEQGRITGLELAWQQDFVFLPDVFSGLGCVLNATFVESSVRVFQRPNETLPFFRQADRLYNAQLYWQSRAFEIRVAWRHQAKALAVIGPTPINDLYSAPRRGMDARMSWRFRPGLAAVVSGRNLTDAASETTWGNTGQIGTGGGFERLGRTYTIGLEWNL
jgi:TonB-dependent receptor